MAVEQHKSAVGARLTVILLVFSAAVGSALALLLLLQHGGVALPSLDAAYFALGLAGAAALAIAARLLAPSGLLAREPGTPAIFRGLALATDTASAPFFLGLTGAVFAWGHDGLAFALGLGAGYLLLQLLVAPLLPRTGVRSLPEFFAVRFGATPRRLAAVAVTISMVTLLAAQLMAAGLVGARLLGVEFGAAVAVAALALLVCFALRGVAGTTFVRGVVFPLMLVAFLAPAVQLSAEMYGVPVPQIAYANAIWQIQGLEEALLEQDLADPAVLKPMLPAFVSLNALNFLGIVLGLAVGAASLPHVLSRHLMVPPVRAARWSAVWGLFFALLLLSAAPALAAYAKLEVVKLIADHTEPAKLPEWIFTYGKLGLVEICGRPATDVATIAKACAGLPDASASLRLQDVTLHPDMVTLGLPEIAGLDHALLGLLAAAALAAALVTADGPLLAIAGALGWDAGAEPRPSGAARLVPYAVAAGAVLLAGAIAAARPASMLAVATWAFTLAASGLFPALVAALWWKRANAAGITAAMIAGLALAVIYLVGTRWFAVGFYETWPSLSGAGQMSRETFAELKEAWAMAAPGDAKDAAWTALDAQAQTIANWWGVKPLATALLTLPAGFVALIVASLLTPARHAGGEA